MHSKRKIDLPFEFAKKTRDDLSLIYNANQDLKLAESRLETRKNKLNNEMEVIPPFKQEFQEQAESEQVLQPKDFNFKNKFWYLVFLLLLIPSLKSGFINLKNLFSNISHNGELNQIKKDLESDKKEIQGKIREYHSQSGMKRTIKEEIKVIEKNEILVRLGK